MLSLNKVVSMNICYTLNLSVAIYTIFANNNLFVRSKHKQKTLSGVLSPSIFKY